MRRQNQRSHPSDGTSCAVGARGVLRRAAEASTALAVHRKQVKRMQVLSNAPAYDPALPVAEGKTVPGAAAAASGATSPRAPAGPDRRVTSSLWIPQMRYVLSSPRACSPMSGEYRKIQNKNTNKSTREEIKETPLQISVRYTRTHTHKHIYVY